MRMLHGLLGTLWGGTWCHDPARRAAHSAEIVANYKAKTQLTQKAEYGETEHGVTRHDCQPVRWGR